jgi:hypothetical protein
MLKTILAAALMSAAAPAFAAEMTPMKPDAMGTNAMGAPDAMGGDAMGAMGTDAMGAMSPDMMPGAKLVQITIQNLTTGQPFSPSFFESRAKDGKALFKLGDKAADALVAVAEGGNIGDYSVGAAKDMGQTLGDAALAVHVLPGQTRTLTIHVDEKHPLIDGVWMLGNTNDGFSGFSGVEAYDLMMPVTVEVRGYDAGSEKNNEKKGYLGALGGGNMRDPENGAIAYHKGIRGDADAPKDWNWDVSKPVAKITISPVPATGG